MPCLHLVSKRHGEEDLGSHAIDGCIASVISASGSLFVPAGCCHGPRFLQFRARTSCASEQIGALMVTAVQVRRRPHRELCDRLPYPRSVALKSAVAFLLQRYRSFPTS